MSFFSSRWVEPPGNVTEASAGLPRGFRAAGVACGIKQSGAPLGNGVYEFSLDVFDGLGEIGNLLRLVSKGDHEEFVLRIRCFEEFDDRFAGPFDFAAHAAAHIEDDAERDGSIFTGKMADILLILTFVNRLLLIG